MKVEVEKGIAVLLLNRPGSYNALDADMMNQITHHMTKLAVDDKAQGIIITGAGKAFCAGGDLKWALSYPDGLVAAFHKLAGIFHQGMLEIRRMKKPVIAAINGIAAGGGFSLSLACDFRIIAESAALRQAYTSNGLSMDGGGTFALPRIVGYARALEILAFDKLISAKQALDWGLVTKIVGDGHTKEAAISMIKELQAGSLHSFGLSKQLLTDSFNTSLETQLELERIALCRAAGHAHALEGLQAFVEKRKPEYENM